MGLSRKGLKIFLCSMHTEYMMHTVYICKISSPTFSLVLHLTEISEDWSKSSGKWNSSAPQLSFLFSEESPLFSPNSCFWWCIFCPNTYYHSIWTPVRSCCSRMWSGSEGHKLMNISLPHFVCHPTHIFSGNWIKKGGRSMIRLQNAWQREGRNGQVEAGHPNAVGAVI